MPETAAYIQRISDKLQQLLKQLALLQKENGKLAQQLAEVKKNVKEKEAYINLLALRIEVLKAAKGVMTEEEKKLFEKKISTYLKDIDKCIAFFNE